MEWWAYFHPEDSRPTKIPKLPDSLPPPPPAPASYVVPQRESNRLEAEGEGLTNMIAEYRAAVGTLDSKLKEAYDGIKKQNESLKELVTQRDEFVKKYNDSVRERNDIVAKYNVLADQVKKQPQGGGR